MKKLLPLLLALSLLTGCAAPSAEPETPDPPPPVQEEQPPSPVYTDWSKLTPYETAEPLYTYHAAYGQPLQARDDYGTLLPYVGTMADVDNYIVNELPLFGLVTAEGELVTEPVYANFSNFGSFLVLAQGYSTGYRDTEWGKVLEGDFHDTIAAPDGSWTRELGNCYSIWLFGNDQLAATLTDGSALVLNSDGTIAAQFPRSAFEPYLGKDFQWTWEGGPNLMEDNGILVVWWYNEDNADDTHQYVAYLDMANGTVSDQPPEGWAPFDYSTYVPDETQEPPELENYGYLDTIVDSVTGKTYYYGYDQDTGKYNLLDKTGQVIFSDCDLSDVEVYSPFVIAGLVSTVEDNAFCYKNIETGKTVFRYPIRSNSD